MKVLIKRHPLTINRAVIFALVLREGLSRIGKRRMGAVWLLIEPLLHLLLFTVVISYLRGRQIADIEYPLFLLIGLAPFLYFRNTALNVMEGVSANSGLFAYKQIQPLDVFISRSLLEFILASIVYCLLLGGFGWYGWDISITRPVEWMFVIAVGAVFSLSLGIVLAVIVNAVPETKSIIRMSFLPLYLMSGVVIPPSHLPAQWMPLLLWNPFLHILELLRSAVFPYYQPVYGVSLDYVLVVTFISLFCGLGLYRARRLKLKSIR